MHRCISQPDDTPEAAITEIASLLAEAIHRLKSRRRLPSETSRRLSESAAQGLEFPDRTRLSVPSG